MKSWADKLGVELFNLGDVITRRDKVQDVSVPLGILPIYRFRHFSDSITCTLYERYITFEINQSTIFVEFQKCSSGEARWKEDIGNDGHGN